MGSSSFNPKKLQDSPQKFYQNPNKTQLSKMFNQTAPLSNLLKNKKNSPLLPTKSGRTFRSRVRLKPSKTMTELPQFETRMIDRRHTYKDLGRILNLPKYTETSTNYTNHHNKYKISGISTNSHEKREPYNGTPAISRVRSYIRKPSMEGSRVVTRKIYSKSPKKSRDILFQRIE